MTSNEPASAAAAIVLRSRRRQELRLLRQQSTCGVAGWRFVVAISPGEITERGIAVFAILTALGRYLARAEHRIADDDFAVLPPG